MTNNGNIPTEREIELAILDRLPPIPPDPTVDGIFTSQQIKEYSEKYRMVDPLVVSGLKRASYELRVGAQCLLGDKIVSLAGANGAGFVTIKPFDVVVLQTLERVNMPDFVIGRWNLRVKWAYHGLLWVGGPQVDPGYQGFLFCPLYNLSDSEVRLQYGEAIATIDFSSTMTPDPTLSVPYPKPKDRKRVVLPDYRPDHGLRSALVTEVRASLVIYGETLQDLRARFDLFVTLTFAVLSVLVGALAVLASKTDHGDFGTSDAATAVAAFFAMLAWFTTLLQHDRVTSTNPTGSSRKRWQIIGVIALFGISCTAWFVFSAYRTTLDTVYSLQTQVQQLGTEVRRITQFQSLTKRKH